MNSVAAWVRAKAWLKSRGYGEMFADTLKLIEKQGKVWYLIAAFNYIGTDKRVEIWIDDESEDIIKYKVEP